MKKAVWSGAVATAVLLLGSTTASAQQTANASIAVTANVNAKAKLSLGLAAITFADADPDVTPLYTSAAVSVDVKARTTAGGNVLLTVLASGDLTASPTVTIPIGTLTWAATGTGFTASGANNSTTAQTLGQWSGSGNPSGSHTLSLPNLWTYNTGTYTVTLNYTLTAP
jgi:hypothetical protein